MTDVVSNWDYSRSFIAFPDITVSVRYFEDPAQVRQLLLQAIEGADNILKTPAPVVRLDDFGVNGYVFLIRAFISSEKTLEQWDIASNVRFSIVKNLREHGIELSFPIQIVHLKQDGSSQKN
jgi:small-conductance mechanosensitive channel